MYTNPTITTAASTGEEPFSIAMTLTEALGARASAASVIATDIDTQVLAKAAAGFFTMEQVSKLTPARLKRFFLKGAGAHEGKVRILTHQAQDVHRHRHRHCGQSANSQVGVKLTAGQTLPVPVGLELRMKPLVRGLVFVQINGLET